MQSNTASAFKKSSSSVYLHLDHTISGKQHHLHKNQLLFKNVTEKVFAQTSYR